jgi:hypothetical protein
VPTSRQPQGNLKQSSDNFLFPLQASALSAFQTASDISDVKNAIVATLANRTNDTPPCKNIEKIVGGKVNKVFKRLNRHTKA